MSRVRRVRYDIAVMIVGSFGATDGMDGSVTTPWMLESGPTRTGKTGWKMRGTMEGANG